MCERENGETQDVDIENTQGKVYSQRQKTRHYTKWEEGSFYSHPRSSLTRRHINMGNEEAHKLCLIEYDSMTHSKY